MPLLGFDASYDAPQGYAPPPNAHLQPTTQSEQPHVLTQMPRATEDIMEEAVEQELADIRQPKRAPRWLFETLKDNKLDAPLQARTRAAAKRDFRIIQELQVGHSKPTRGLVS